MGNIQKVLADNLSALMIFHGLINKDGTPSQSALSRKSGVDQRTIGRILSMDMAPTVTKLEEIANSFGYQTWQLLVPFLDPSNPPTFAMTKVDRELYSKLSSSFKELFNKSN